MTTTEPLTQLGDAFKEARVAKGWTIDEATFQARLQYPELRIGRGQIVRYERPIKNRDRIDLPVAFAIAELYDLELADVAPDLGERWEAIKRLAGQHSPWSGDPLPTSPIRPLQAA